MGDEVGARHQPGGSLEATLALQNRALLTLLARRNGVEGGRRRMGSTLVLAPPAPLYGTRAAGSNIDG